MVHYPFSVDDGLAEGQAGDGVGVSALRQGCYYVIHEEINVPGLRDPTLNPSPLSLVKGNFQSIALARTLRVARAVADSAIGREVSRRHRSRNHDSRSRVSGSEDDGQSFFTRAGPDGRWLILSKVP